MKKIILVLAILLSGVILYADEPVFPALTGPVVDTASLLSTEQVKLLSEKSLSFQNSKGSQIAVCIVPTTSPLTIEDYGIQLSKRWKIGRSKIDDGIIIIVAKNDRKMRIEVGYGLEHAVTDLRAGRIVDYIMAPEFCKGDFYKGIDASIDSLITFINGGDITALSSEKSESLTSSSAGSNPGFSFGVALIVASVILFIVFMAKGKAILSLFLTYFPLSSGLYLTGAGSISESAIIGVVLMVLFELIAIMIKKSPSGGSSGSSGYSSYSSSSDYSSSSGSDSYSGGGGDYGGGGASGSW